MLKPPMPNLPGVGAVTDTLDFVKNLWGSMGVPGIGFPGMAAPSLSLDDLDKKISDLKAVESWLAVNSSMLRGTIQALEVQRGTIATLKSMGATLAQAVKQPGANEKTVMAAAPFVSAFFPQPAPEAAKPVKQETVAEAAPEAKPAEPAAVHTPADTGADASANAAAQLANPSIWWNMLQDQFKHAVSAAMSSEAMAGATALAQDAAAKMKAASTGPAAQVGKTAGKAMDKAEAKPAAAKAPAKRAPAKPRASKPKTAKE